MTDPLLRFRDEFPILARSTYLVSNSLGAMPRATRDRLLEYADAWETLGVRAWAQRWWEMPVTVGDEIAPLLGAGAGEVAMVPNVTAAMAAVVSALDFAPGDAIVMTALDFPSVRYVVDALAARLGARVVVVPSDDGLTIDAGRVVDAIDERTRLVAVSHVLFRSAYVVDVAPIVRRAREVGALVALDAYHSVGVVPVDVRGLDVDFLTGGVLKWLCGGPGGSFLWTRPGLDLRPSVTGWQAHARPFAFESTMEHAEGAWRWLGGTPSVPALYAAIEGPRIVRAAGIDAIRAKSTRQTARLIALADARGFPVHAPRDPARRGGTVAFDVPHAYEVAQSLLARDIVVDYRPGAGIRVAPHFYTTDDELEAAVVAIDEILTSGEWQTFAGRRSVVT
ncbi:aminotransferase class V [Gemmatirosa kalamazoonensis]|uniref:Aminotransferase class V n=1 Tax=Gemmatirosa kalamazoonensis TaxID=861299 RepID=W0RL18_9BACT|nr:aminotransferase class V-fold PLP-dependent enzyme [Gemmatirosa kalamazoonensis]AHG91759.1 aminotransferase class V [Gemmatirosa kalamazoonensis]